MSIKPLTLHRLNKEQAQLERQPIPNALVKRQDILKFYFCLYNLQGSYAGGFYFGLLQLHENYPFNAPKLIFYTPSGRFEINLPICTSFTNYHQQSWTTAWNVRTLILGTISFMYSEQPSYGCCHFSHQERVKMAKQSLKYNMKNDLFVRLFSQQLTEMNLLLTQVTEEIDQKQKDQQIDSKNGTFAEEDGLKQIQVGIKDIERQENKIELELPFKIQKDEPKKHEYRSGKNIIVGVIVGGLVLALLPKIFKIFKSK